VKEMTGEVEVIDCDFADWSFEYANVDGEKDDLVDFLREFRGKKVKITVQVIEE
jgi:hypothetical protein